jgi:hypothetical protein
VEEKDEEIEELKSKAEQEGLRREDDIARACHNIRLDLNRALKEKEEIKDKYTHLLGFVEKERKERKVGIHNYNLSIGYLFKFKLEKARCC